MESRFSWRSPSSQLVLSATLDALAQLGYARLTVEEIQVRAGTPGVFLEDSDLEEIVVVALQRVRLFPTPAPMGSLRADLHSLLRPWLGPLGPHERAVAAVLSAAEWNPRLKHAVREAFDRPLAQAIGELLTRAMAEGHVCPRQVQTLNWILRGLALGRLWAPVPRTHVDLSELVDCLLAGLAGGRGDVPC
jgi:hypothetical protein